MPSQGSEEVPAGSETRALVALIEREMARLRARLETSLLALDESLRRMAAVGLSFEEDAETARLRKFEAASQRRRNWALAELRKIRSGRIPTGELPAPKERPVTETKNASHTGIRGQNPRAQG